jgi:hypothetical protein
LKRDVSSLTRAGVVDVRHRVGCVIANNQTPEMLGRDFPVEARGRQLLHGLTSPGFALVSAPG